MKTILIVARHGNTFDKGDVILRVGARTDLPLTLEGRNQGKRLAERLRERGLTPSRVFVAPLRRTQETGQEIADAFALDSALIVEPFLTEFDYGEDDGKSEKDVATRLGRCEADAGEGDANEDFESLGKIALKRWDSERRTPRGWSFLSSRVKTLLCDWRAFADNLARNYQDETVVAVTSNGIARFALDVLPEGAQKPEQCKLSTGAFAVFEYDGVRWTLKEWNV